VDFFGAAPVSRPFLGEKGAWALAQSPHLARLTVLDLGDNRISSKGVRAVAESPHLDNLASLNLEGTDVGDDGARALAQSTYLAYLRFLKLDYSGLGRPVVDLVRGRWPIVQPGWRSIRN
jgi:hypothetical protein